jgi:hypothetical protein
VPKTAELRKGFFELFLNQLFSTTCDYPLFWDSHRAQEVARWICIGIEHHAYKDSDRTHFAAHF